MCKLVSKELGRQAGADAASPPTGASKILLWKHSNQSGQAGGPVFCPANGKPNFVGGLTRHGIQHDGKRRAILYFEASSPVEAEEAFERPPDHPVYSTPHTSKAATRRAKTVAGTPPAPGSSAHLLEQARHADIVAQAVCPVPVVGSMIKSLPRTRLSPPSTIAQKRLYVAGRASACYSVSLYVLF